MVMTAYIASTERVKSKHIFSQVPCLKKCALTSDLLSIYNRLARTLTKFKVKSVIFNYQSSRNA